MATRHFPFLVAIETDPARYHGERPVKPAILSQQDAEQMLAHLAADLDALIPAAVGCNLVAAGALFDQTQVLRPGYPIYRALASLLPVDRGDGGIQNRLVSLGGRDGAMPVPDLEPEPDLPPGILQVLAVGLSGAAERVEPVGREMEHLFLERGQLSPNSAQWLASAFGIEVRHARFMTLNDLLAMFRLQLEHFGFLPLWELVDAALADDSHGSPGALEVETETGLQASFSNGEVTIRFDSFDSWALNGGGASLRPENRALSAAYADWTRDFRRFTNTLESLHIPVGISAPSGDRGAPGAGYRVEATYCVETRPTPAAAARKSTQSSASRATLTEHSVGDLGTVAVTAASDDELAHYFPTRPEGLNDIHRDIARAIGNGDSRPAVAFPGTILYDERQRTLTPDRG